MTDSDAVREKAGGRAVLLVILGLLVLVGGGWAAAYYFAGDKVPRGTTVAGIEIGGQTQADAAETLEEGLADRVDEPMTVKVDTKSREITPAQAGLGVDYLGSVANAGGEKTWDPMRLWEYYTGGDELDPVVDVDDTAMEKVVTNISTRFGSEPKDGAVTFDGGEATVSDPEPGRALDPGVARQAIVAAYLSEDRTVELELQESAPEIDEDAVQAALDEFANPALSAPVNLVFGESPVRLAPKDYSAALSMVPEGGALVPRVDAEKLTALVQAGVSQQDKPVDATVRLVDGKPKVIPAKPGVTFDPADVSEAFLTLVTAAEGQRSMDVKSTVAEPEFTTADARKLGIKERVSTFTTYFPPAAYRDTNIGRAAELVDGTLLKPGETFSMNDIVGERTAENGFTDGFIISNGIFKEDLGGGVSQMATTLYNAGFFAGLEDVEHKPHSFYIDRYPVGREATVAWGAVDLRFRNDTQYGVLVHANVIPSAGRSQGEVTVSLYSTKVWDIETTTSDRYAFTSPATRTLDTPDCYANSGYGGFDVDVTRIFKKPGSSAVEKTEKITTTYTPSDTVICKPPGSLSGGGGGGGGANN